MLHRVPLRRASLLLVLFLVGVSPALANGEETLDLVVGAGHFHAGLIAVGVGEVAPGTGAMNLARFPFAADPCHPGLDIILDYSPRNASASAQPLLVEASYTFQVELFDATTNTRLPGGTLRYASPGLAHYQLDAAMTRGVPLRADLYMLEGLEADWSLRVRGWLQHEGCVIVSEVEADPAGPDAGTQWVELANLGLGSVDLSGWNVRGHNTSVTLPQGSSIAGDARLVVPMGLARSGEVVELRAPDGALYARTPSLTDTSDDARTNQLATPTGRAWVFQAGTPGEP